MSIKMVATSATEANHALRSHAMHSKCAVVFLIFRCFCVPTWTLILLTYWSSLDILVGTLQRFQLTYYLGWKVSFLSLADQVLIAMMKLRLNLRAKDLGFRFAVSRTTISNIFHTIVKSLHEIFFSLGC